MKKIILTILISTISLSSLAGIFQVVIPQPDRITNNDFDGDGILDKDDSTPFGGIPGGSGTTQPEVPSNIQWGNGWNAAYPAFAGETEDFELTVDGSFQGNYYPAWSRTLYQQAGTQSVGTLENENFKILWLGDCGNVFCIIYKAAKSSYVSAEDALDKLSSINIDGTSIQASLFVTTWVPSAEDDTHYFGAKYGTHPLTVGGDYVVGGDSSVTLTFD